MSKLTGLHAIFRKISIYGLIISFHALTLAWSLGGFFKAEGDRSGGYRGNFDQSIVHGQVVDACCPAYCCARTSASTGQTKDDNARIHLSESANFIGTMLCALTGHCVHQTCLQLNMCRTFLGRGFDA